jgi:hypothetical protein
MNWIIIFMGAFLYSFGMFNCPLDEYTKMWISGLVTLFMGLFFLIADKK